MTRFEHVHLEIVLPEKAMPVGIFKPLANTETVNPGGTAMSCPLSGAKNAVSTGHSGLATVAACAAIGDISNGATPSAAVKMSGCFSRMAYFLPSLALARDW